MRVKVSRDSIKKPGWTLLFNSFTDIVDKECPYLTGVALGGSSAVNNFLYTRGSQDDFDKWQEMGNVGWSYKDLLPYFKKVERRRTISASFSEEISDGALNIEHPRYTTGLLPVYLRAGRELGWKLIDYNNAMDQIGIGIAQGTTLRGRRQSAAGAYIHPTYQDRPNLHILTNTRAMKVLINEETKEAYAVKYKYDGVETVVEAKKEIILSAGAIGSAHLLMLSGVGPKKRLAKASIPVLHELPVGETFYTNVAVHAPHFLVNTSLLSIHIKRLGVKDILELNSGRGVLTSFTGSEALSFLKTPFSESSSNQPDVELQFVSAGLQSDLGMGFRKAAQIKEEVYEQLFSSIENTDNDVWSTIVTNLHSKTRGHLTLVNSDIDTDPILNYPYFEDPSDLKTIVYGIKEAIKMVDTQSFRSIGARLHDVPLASCSHFAKDTDQYWECYARHLTVIVPQMVATNRMGPATDPGAVVDQELRVRGIRNLRVADTSVVPTTISGHLQAISYVIGEKLSDILKMEWKSMSNSIRDEY